LTSIFDCCGSALSLGLLPKLHSPRFRNMFFISDQAHFGLDVL